MKLDIVTPEMEVYSGNVKSAKFPGSEGSFGVLNGHAPLISTLQEGQIVVVEDGNMEKSFKLRRNPLSEGMYPAGTVK